MTKTRKTSKRELRGISADQLSKVTGGWLSEAQCLELGGTWVLVGNGTGAYYSCKF